MLDKEGNKICSKYEYEYIIKNNKEKRKENLFILINKNMMHNLTNKAFTQYFSDATYHCIPPTIRRYKLFIIPGFNLKEKKNLYLLCCSYS